jgi:hypothetical protein
MSNCGCDGNSGNLNILQRNNLLPGNTANNGVLNVNNQPMVNNQPLVNNQPMINNQPLVNNYPQVNQESIGPINNLVKGEPEEEEVLLQEEKSPYREDAKMVLFFLLALAIHDAVKFFISQSIRMNKGSSSRFIYYPVVVLAVLILINLF